MRNFLAVIAALMIALTLSCGGDSGNGGDEQAAGHGEESQPVGDTGSGNIGDEDVCRVQMESIAMMLLNEVGMTGSLPETLEDFQELNPAYAEFEITCGGTPYEYETDGENFTITCPNGHGSIHNDEPTWSW